jgi:hypothetical protein
VYPNAAANAYPKYPKEQENYQQSAGTPDMADDQPSDEADTNHKDYRYNYRAHRYV